MTATTAATQDQTEASYQERLKRYTTALRNGAIFPTAGLLGNVIRVLVSLAISDEQLAEGLDILEESFGEVLG